MKQAERSGLPEEQRGGRKGRSATELGLDKSLVIEYIILSSTIIGIVELDAQACFDQMIKSGICVALRNPGLHTTAAKWLLTFLDSLKNIITISAHEAE